MRLMYKVESSTLFQTLTAEVYADDSLEAFIKAIGMIHPYTTFLAISVANIESPTFEPICRIRGNNRTMPAKLGAQLTKFLKNSHYE